MRRLINDTLRQMPVWLVWMLGLLPLALLVWDIATDALGVDPVAEIEHRLGQTALYFLAGGLAVTPLLRITGITLMKFRRALGLLCFFYVVLHVLTWIAMDMGFLWPQMGRDVIKRPYLIFGMLALLLLLPLAVTSNNLSIRRMGGQGWRKLHRLVYVAAPLAGLHWLWTVKVNELTPMFWMAVILALLGLRVVVRRPLGRARPGIRQKNHSRSIS